MTDQWQPIATAPKDKRLLLYGTLLQPFEGLRVYGPEAFSGYWDDLDGAWCGSGSIWTGPFYTATHWMPLPEPPQ